MNILAFDTSSDTIYLALSKHGDVSGCCELNSKGGLKQLADAIKALGDSAEMALEEIDLVAYGEGPGSFTGVRISAAYAQSLSYGLGARLVAFSSLQLMAQAAKLAEPAVVAIDARMQEAYVGKYLYDVDEGIAVPQCDDMIMSLKSLGELAKNSQPKMGNGWALLKSEGRAVPVLHPIEIMPKHLIELAENYALRQCDISPLNLSPHYIRDKVTS